MRRLLALLMLCPSLAFAQGGLTEGFNQDGTPFDSETGLAVEEGIPEEDLDILGEVRTLDAPKVQLRGLDTLNGQVAEFTVNVGQIVRFERLQIAVLACKYPEGEIAKEAFAFLRIRDSRETTDRFSGWMFASSPALSALDHPRYDVWVLKCSTD